jgi:hypothetical protein
LWKHTSSPRNYSKCADKRVEVDLPQVPETVSDGEVSDADEDFRVDIVIGREVTKYYFLGNFMEEACRN